MNRREFAELDPYVVLNIDKTADSEAIRKAFRKKALKW